MNDDGSVAGTNIDFAIYGTNKVRSLLASYPVTLATALASLALKVSRIRDAVEAASVL